jgi:acyl carrier protein
MRGCVYPLDKRFYHRRKPTVKAFGDEDMIERVRGLLADHGGLAVDVAALATDADLYRAGMSSFASVQLMLALEETFDIEFPESMLSPRTFSSIDAIQAAVSQLTNP